MARRRLFDVPRHEPRHPAARRALRLDLEPQLRGPAGPGRPHPPGQPAMAAAAADRRPLRRRPGVDRLMEPGRDHPGNHGCRCMRSHVDTDQIIPKQFLKRVERTGFGPFLFYDWAYDHEGELRPRLRPQPARVPERDGSGRRAQLRLGIVARARPVGAPRLGHSRPSSPPPSPTSSATTATRTACSPSSSVRNTSRIWPPWPPTPPPKS